MRDLTVAVYNELAAPVVRPFIGAELDFASGFVRAWTGIGQIPISGNTYSGTGNLGKLSPVKESSGFAANGVSLELSGIPSSLLSIALLEKYQGRRGTIWLGFFDATNSIIADPWRAFAGRMDTMTIVEGGDTSVISVQLESRALPLKRSNERRLTHQEQQIDFPGDRGCEYIPSTQELELVWRPH